MLMDYMLRRGDFSYVIGKGGGAFLNEASSPKKNNCGYGIIRPPRHLHTLIDKKEDPFQIVILIYALRYIKQGEELFVSYGNTYWKEEDLATSHLAIEVPTFITREEYYAKIREAKDTTRVVKRMTPTLITTTTTEEERAKKKQRTLTCIQCHSLTASSDDFSPLTFFCQEECRLQYTSFYSL